MCGIIGYIGKKNAIPILLDGLKQLEYRGYDSSGIAYIKENQIRIIKEKGRISNLELLIDKSIDSNIGIAHTRWATHGVANRINAHPHQVGNITIVHNGIIENYLELKEMLTKKKYIFKTDTDSEVACAVIDYLYQKNNNILKSLNEATKIMEGSYALGILVKNDSNIYTIRKDSPLIIGLNNGGNFIASDVPAILKYTNKYILLDNNDIAKINENDVTIYNNNKVIKKDINEFNYKTLKNDKEEYEHYMLKEICEQDLLAKKLINMYLKDKNTLLSKIPNLKKYNKIDIVGCGSAYHAGLIGKCLIEKYANIPVNVEIASEYRYKKLFINNKTLVIGISQSGETADTLASIKIANENKAHTLGIINVEGSSIARECNDVIYLNAGLEIAVATTKAYSMQVLCLSFIALSLALQKNLITNVAFKNIINEYIKLPNIIKKEIIKDYTGIAKKIYKKNDIFFIGRNIDYALSLEGSLKLKEISYIHSEAYAAGELKHGTISLIEKNTPVIAIITDESIKDKTISNIKEVKARGAYVILIISKNLDIESDFYDKKIIIDNLNNLTNPLITIIPLQLISYEVAKLKGCDIDKPRNLAKSVTVE